MLRHYASRLFTPLRCVRWCRQFTHFLQRLAFFTTPPFISSFFACRHASAILFFAAIHFSPHSRISLVTFMFLRAAIWKISRISILQIDSFLHFVHIFHFLFMFSFFIIILTAFIILITDYASRFIITEQNTSSFGFAISYGIIFIINRLQRILNRNFSDFISPSLQFLSFIWDFTSREYFRILPYFQPFQIKATSLSLLDWLF